MSKLSCGGKGPCCHVGYAHRHCEHCDVVIATSYHVPQWQPYPWQTTWYSGQIGTSSLANQLQQALGSGHVQ